MTLAHQLAEFVLATPLEQVPARVQEDAVFRFVDTIGVALAGTRMEHAAAVRRVAGDMGGRQEATVIGFGDRLPAPNAGLVNGALAHGPDFDDTHSVAMVHIGCLAVPAALAMAERVNASGAECLAAMITGAEVGLRIAAAAPHRFHLRHYHATSVVGPFVAAAVGARLLGLDEAGTANALGIAGSQAAGLMQGLRDGSWVKRLHPGFAIQSGLWAALLAEQGFTGPAEVLEGGAGLYAVLLHGDDVPVRLDTVTEGLGQTWLLPDTTYKPYPCGAWNHSSMDAVIGMMRSHGLGHQDIDSIDVRVPPECMPVVCEPREVKIRPQTVYHMKFSLPYTVAMLAVLGHVELEDFNATVLADRRITDLAERIRCTADSRLRPDRFPARVTLHTTTGRRFERDVPAQRGGPGNPMSLEELRRKFLSNATPTLGEDRATALLGAIEDLPHSAAVGVVASLMGGRE